MTITVNGGFIEFTPESNEDWFLAGRITKNLGVDARKSKQHLVEQITKIEVPLNAVLLMLENGGIPVFADL